MAPVDSSDLVVAAARPVQGGAVTNGQLYAQAMASTLRIIETVSQDRWHAPTPCTEWDARQVANHIIGENLWAGELFCGKTVAEVGSALDGDLTGDDPAAAYPSTNATACLFLKY